MDYSFEIKNRDGVDYLHMEISGAVTNESMGSAIVDAIQNGVPKGVRHALWDMRESHLDESFIDVHTFMEGLEQYGVQARFKIALVYKNNESIHKHAENVVINRGFSGFCYFTDGDEALRWLVED